MIKPQTLDETGNSTSKYGKFFVVSDAKIGKTTFLACSVLGCLPEQEFGLVDKPEHLHIIAFDESAVDGLKEFIADACKRPDCLKMTIWNMSTIARNAVLGGGYDSTIMNTILAVLAEINKRAALGGVHAVLFSSFSRMGMALKYGLAGKPTPNNSGQVMSSGMNQTKWDILNADLETIRSEAHRDNKHVFWEGHVQTKFVMGTEENGQKSQGTEETVGVPGGEGRNWAANVAQVMRLRRDSVKYPGTLIDKVSLDTRPSADFISGGRGFNKLAPKEYDIAKVCKILGLEVGGYKKP